MAQINTKHNVGDELWTCRDGRACKFKVAVVSVVVSEGLVTESYIPEGSFNIIEPEDCFETKEELALNFFRDCDDD